MRALALALLLAMPATAHEAPSGWHYDPGCCSGQDCAQAPVHAVSAAVGGWRIRIMPGEHPMVPTGWSGFVPYDAPEIRHSGDEFFHVCLGPTGRLWCLYVPDFGG